MKFKLENIISECKKQNQIAQKQLYEHTYIELATSVALYTKDLSERDWVFNMGMFRIFNSLENYKKNSNYLGWARTILTRTAIDNIRKKTIQNKVMITVDIQQYENKTSDIETGLNKLEAEEIITLIQRLPDRERLIFTMYEIDGYKHSEIEKITKIKINTSKWLLARAKKSLQSMIDNLFNLNQRINE